MKIHVLFFAQLREMFGTSERTVEVGEGATAGEVARSVFGSAGTEADALRSVRYAVNEHFEDGQKTLNDGDVLAFIPPVAGG